MGGVWCFVDDMLHRRYEVSGWSTVMQTGKKIGLISWLSALAPISDEISVTGCKT
jgi:hypothetical protein